MTPWTAWPEPGRYRALDRAGRLRGVVVVQYVVGVGYHWRWAGQALTRPMDALPRQLEPSRWT